MAEKLLDRLDGAIRIRGYGVRTAEAYRSWVARYIRFHGLRHPAELDGRHLEAFLVDVARSRAGSSVNQAHAAVLFLYRHVLKVEPAGLEALPWSRGRGRVPSVLSRQETRALLVALRGPMRLFCALLYGSGLRLGEGVALRVKDLDLQGRRVVVRAGKGGKDRVTLLPTSLVGRWRGF